MPRKLRIAVMAFVAVWSFGAVDTYGQEPQPGDACPVASRFITVAGPENPGSGHFLYCDANLVWQPVIRFQSAGHVLFHSSGLPAAPLHVWGEAIIGHQGLTCSGTTEGALRYDSAGDLWQYCDSTAWQDLASGSGSAPAAGNDREIQFNSGGAFAAADTLKYFSNGDFVVGSPQLDGDGNSDHYARMFFDKSKAAFRVGLEPSNDWDEANVGKHSIGMGREAEARGVGAIAIGHFTKAFGDHSVALGRDSRASSTYAVAIGANPWATGNRSVAIGANGNATGGYSVAIGDEANASGEHSFAFGHEVIAGSGTAGDGAGDGSMAIGLTDANVTTGPMVTGKRSLGVFMGAQEAVDLSANNTVGLFGGKVIVDPNVPATKTAPDAPFEVIGEIKFSSSGLACAGSMRGAMLYDSAAGKFQVCADEGTGWENLSTGSGGTPPGGSDTEIQFNSGGTFAGSSNFTWDDSSRQLNVSGGSSVPTITTNSMSISRGWAGSTPPLKVRLSDDQAKNPTLVLQHEDTSGYADTGDEASIEFDIESQNSTSMTTAGRVNFGWSDYTDSNDNAYFGIHVRGGGTLNEQVRLTSAGHLGVGTAAPAAPLHVWGEAIIGNQGLACSGVTEGALRYDSAVELWQYCDSGAWQDLASGSGSVWEVNSNVVRTFSGTVDYASADFVFGSPQLADDGNSDHRRRMWFDKSKGAFRAGDGGTSSDWDDAQVGLRSVAMGHDTRASGDYSFAMGRISRATGTTSTSIGDYTHATGEYSVALGIGSASTGRRSVALGDNPTASGDWSLALGRDTTASAQNSIVMGRNSTASGENSIAIGRNPTAGGTTSVAIGYSTTASGENSTAIGRDAMAGSGTAGDGTGDGAMAIGLTDASITTDPKVTGKRSMGVFMGAQEAVDLSANNTVGLFGGKVIVDPNVPATKTAPDAPFEVIGEIKFSSSGLACGGTTEGTLRWNQSEKTVEMCDGTDWRLIAATSTSADCTPDAFSFTDLTGQPLSTLVGSNIVNITGIDAGCSVSVTGGGSPQISVNGGSWVTVTSIDPGDTLQVRMTTSSSHSTEHIASVTVGTNSDNWNVTTKAGGTRIFATSGSYNGSLGGIAGGDNICQTAASNQGYGGSWYALLSSSGIDANARLTIDYPVVRASDGTTVDSVNLWDSGLENSVSPSGGRVWTGTDTDGTKQPSGSGQGWCDDWRATGGNAIAGDEDVINAGWIWADTRLCSETFPLYCIDQATALGTILSINPASENNFYVGGTGSPAYGDAITFTVENVGDQGSATISTSVSNTTNFEITTDNCNGTTLAVGATCTVEISPKATLPGGEGTISGSFDISADNNPSASLSGSAGGTRLFETTNAYNGNLGGLTGADSNCASEATSRGYSGTWKALLSDSATNARDRLTITYPVVNAEDPSNVIDSTNLWDGSVEDATFTTSSTWTGTNSDGTKNANTCNDWSDGTSGVNGRVGAAGASEWIDRFTDPCSDTLKLYCAEQ